MQELDEHDPNGTHEEYMNYLKKYDPITYSEMTSDPTGAGGDSDFGYTAFSIIMMALLTVGYLYFFGGK